MQAKQSPNLNAVVVAKQASITIEILLILPEEEVCFRASDNMIYLTLKIQMQSGYIECYQVTN